MIFFLIFKLAHHRHNIGTVLLFPRKGIHLKSCGYNDRDIARSQNTTMKRVQELLEEVHSVLLEICYG